MKKIFTVLLCVCLTVGVAAGCGTKQAETEAEKTETEKADEVKVYPEHIGDFMDTADFSEPPEIIYTTPASENGLEGELYKIEGEVTESEVTEGEEGISIGSFTVKTDIGEVSVLDSSVLLGGFDGFASDETMQKYFAIPKVGEKVCVYVEYVGYSELLKTPACYYGGQYYVDRVFGVIVRNYVEGTQETEKAQEQTAKSQTQSVPTEYKSALNKAKSYSDMLHMSKKGIYDQLVSEYGENFSADAAQYAVDNLQANYKANALKTAENYQDMMDMSPASIYEQLVSEYGEQFTAEEAQYAIDNLK
jgi:hypothetical protein